MLIFPAALPIGSCQRLTAAHDYLESVGVISSGKNTFLLTLVGAAVQRETSYHAILPVVVTEDREASSLPEFGHLLQLLIIYVHWDDDSWRVGGTHCVVSVHSAQSPPFVLQTQVRKDDVTVINN